MGKKGLTLQRQLYAIPEPATVSPRQLHTGRFPAYFKENFGLLKILLFAKWRYKVQGCWKLKKRIDVVRKRCSLFMEKAFVGITSLSIWTFKAESCHPGQELALRGQIWIYSLFEFNFASYLTLRFCAEKYLFKTVSTKKFERHGSTYFAKNFTIYYSNII